MGRKYAIILYTLAAVLIAESQIAVEIEEPRFSRFLNRITNTTFGKYFAYKNIFNKVYNKFEYIKFVKATKYNKIFFLFKNYLSASQLAPLYSWTNSNLENTL